MSDFWHKDTTKQISFDIVNTEQLYQVLFFVKTNNDYPYRNIHFFTQVVDPDSISILDTISFNVADVRGKRFGRGRGDIKLYEIQLTKGRFQKGGKYYFNVSQGMREVSLNGVTSVGLSIKEIHE